MKKITVYIISYNQEDVICRTIDSVILQKDYGLYKIIISDDCSMDKTWAIIQRYYKMYPELICPYRNQTNLGIYENMRKVESYLPNSDLYCDLAGDDELCDGYFKRVQELIEEKGINTNDAIGIYSDWASVSPTGKRVIIKQNCVLSGNNLWSLKARGKIGGRSLLISGKVRNGFEPILSGKGLNLTESHYDSQAPLNIKKAYYLPQVTTLYYTGIGVSSRLLVKKSDYLTTQSIEKWEYGLTHYVNNPRDQHLAEYEMIKARFYLNPKWKQFPPMLYHYHKSQLPGARDSISSMLRVFLGLVKYKLTFKAE